MPPRSAHRAVRDLEVTVLPLAGRLAAFDRSDLRHTRTLVQPALEARERLAVALGDHLDRPVVAVPHAPGDAPGRCLAHRCVAEVHALDEAAHDEAGARR